MIIYRGGDIKYEADLNGDGSKRSLVVVKLKRYS